MSLRVDRTIQDLAVAASGSIRGRTEVGASAACLRRIGTLICVLQRSSQARFGIAQLIRIYAGRGRLLLRTAADDCQHSRARNLTRARKQRAPG